jgi:hypothetical protein
MDIASEVDTLFELSAETPDSEGLDDALQYSVTRRGDGQTTPDE